MLTGRVQDGDSGRGLGENVQNQIGCVGTNLYVLVVVSEDMIISDFVLPKHCCKLFRAPCPSIDWEKTLQAVSSVLGHNVVRVVERDECLVPVVSESGRVLHKERSDYERSTDFISSFSTNHSVPRQIKKNKFKEITFVW